MITNAQITALYRKTGSDGRGQPTYAQATLAAPLSCLASQLTASERASLGLTAVDVGLAVNVAVSPFNRVPAGLVGADAIPLAVGDVIEVVASCWRVLAATETANSSASSVRLACKRVATPVVEGQDE